MKISNEQYRQIMREYDYQRQQDRNELKEREKKLYENYPRLYEIHQLLVENAAKRARYKIMGQQELLDQLENEADDLKNEQSGIFRMAEIPEDALEMQYKCPKCKDTGYIGSEKCSCFLQKEVALLYDQSAIREVLQKENFGTLSLKYYSDEPIDGGKSLLERMKICIERCKAYVEHFGEGAQNLYIYGGVGCGKTFLTNCIAKELMDTCHQVVYFSAEGLFDFYAERTFSKDPGSKEEIREHLYNSELLIIDDLGTEYTNALVAGCLFSVINERLLRRKSTIINSNLELREIKDVYGERIISRISGFYDIMHLYGEKDIRIVKKYEDQ